MPLPIAVPIVGAVAVLGLIGLRIRAMMKKNEAPTGETTQSPVKGTEAYNKPVIAPAVAFAPENASEAEKMAAAGANVRAADANPAGPDKVALAAKQAGVSVADFEEAARFMNTTAGALVAMGVSPRDINDAVFQMKAAKEENPAAQSPVDVATPAATSAQVSGKKAVVTTQDPAPSGDLIIRISPSPTAPQVAGGGADKGGTVTIIRDVDATWAEVVWAGGRRPAAQGFARKAYLKLI